MQFGCPGVTVNASPSYFWEERELFYCYPVQATEAQATERIAPQSGVSVLSSRDADGRW